MKIPLMLNGQEAVLEAQPAERLLDVLRREKLTSVKEGCMEGHCGACTVLLDGKPVPSCIVMTGMVKDCSVETLDSFSLQDSYKDIMDGFRQAGVQLCGFCDAGRIFTAYDIICTYTRPDRRQLEAATAHISCCCVEKETYLNGIRCAIACHLKRTTGSKKHD